MGRPRGGQADKRRAILAGALTVFARDGYTRASVDAISAEAGVSTRTVYNHFQDKAHLFRAVIQESAERTAEAQLALVDRHLGKIVALEQDLIDFGVDLARPIAGTAEHFALVRQVNAEAAHIPPEAVEAWQEAGPLRVRRELGKRLAAIPGLRADAPERAALHLMALVSPWNPSFLAGALTDAEITDAVTAGVRAFLYGYAE
ncbi:DNA-binding transcriptional regulator, AcrR family [Actinokineospora alba]|uniref:DNA-binding transcriptional regulator, AcrR family n=1 Tax=Actinokineospora alba TaxID=504798 RepID=A0A1H0W2N9_9PSEU|nr:TetR/AcrR family transcriptional regulator [Actinokineospora alba]TDP67812.1 TetR family transcriptional regulator [Actinokineospora alba]SDI72292.1 DNA-binding transcriptional regulator, AcrR family [Actinokineospora alba]SDP85010.1 DNA-binding transcriptional regulator, AcrR family [Actinokineospora alba]